MKITSYNVKNSVPYELQFEQDGVALATTYSANAEMSDSAIGLAQITIRDASGAIAADANGTPINQLPMFRHPSDASRAVFTVQAGFTTPGDYLYEMWGVIPVGGVNLKVS